MTHTASASEMQSAAKIQRRREAGFNWETLRRGCPLKRECIGKLLPAGSLRFARRLIGFAVKIMGSVTGDSMELRSVNAL
jgi:hypothetical protein